MPEIRDAQLKEAHTIDMAKYNLDMGEKANVRHKPLKEYGGKSLVEKTKRLLFGE